MKILIIGATAGIGRAAVNRALAQGHQVRAFSRSAHTIAIEHPNFEAMEGDARHSDEVTRALEGSDAVIQALGIPASFEMLTGPVTLFSSATSILIPAMQKQGVKRLIAITGYGAGDGRSKIPPLQRLGFELVFARAYADKDKQEQLIKESDLDWTIAGPGVLTNGPSTGRYQILAEPSEWRNGLISRNDVAEFMAQELREPRFLHQTPALVGVCQVKRLRDQLRPAA